MVGALRLAAFAGAGGATSIASVRPGDAQLLVAHPDVFELIEHFSWHSLGKINGAVIVVDLNGADKFVVKPCFIGNGSDDIPRFGSILVTNFDSETLHPKLWAG